MKSLLAAGLWLVAGALGAAPSGPSKQAPVTYRCDRLRMVRVGNQGKCEGHVVVRQRDLLLCCERLTGTANDHGEWQTFVCEGDVRGAQGDLLVWAGRASFDAKTERLVLTEHPRSRRGQSTLWGKRMVISTADGALDVDVPRGHLLPQAPAALETADATPAWLEPKALLPAQCPLPDGPRETAPVP